MEDKNEHKKKKSRNKNKYMSRLKDEVIFDMYKNKNNSDIIIYFSQNFSRSTVTL